MPFNPRKIIFTEVVEWVKVANGFAEKLDRIHAEVWGLYFGLKLAVEKGITNLAIEKDATGKNCVVDYLANWSYNLDLEICFFDETPVWVRALLVDDLLGLARPRLMRNV
ncbi:Hypothetical predicted protein [Prunus dulcis]|uniref:RNase H type-1 domain-containing protein n=1 Tax=Prunus dulcis TaxID=3755 RepID=A0A5E4FHZ4_PRUDU|nr:Hypothetical predicted protein [Prunus dulcis]